MWIFNRVRHFRFFLSLVLFQLPVTLLLAELNGRDRSVEKLFVQDLQVSVGGSPVGSGSTHNFGNVNLLSSSSALTIVLENIGSPEDLIINNVSLTGANSSDFTLNISGLQNTLGPAANTSFTVSFTPTLSGTRTAAIEIDSDDPDINPFVINLEGEGLKLNQTITFNPLGAKTYGDASFLLGATASSSLPVSYSSSDPGVATISGSTITIVGAGSTIITASQGGNPTYNAASDETQILTVNKATLTATANNQSRAYGAANPALTISYTGFVNSETSSLLDTAPTATSTATPTSPVATYPITASGGSDNNYDFVYTAGTLTITKATVTATAVDASRTYGASNPSFTITYTGFLNGENSSVLDVAPTASTAATIASNVGTYPITVSGGSDNNYNISYAAGTLTITKATVTATAVDASRTYGASNPSFTMTYTGFLNGENSSVLDTTPTAATAATNTSNVGTYPITVSGGSDNNYNISYAAGTLTITKATVTATAVDASRTYGASNPSFTMTYSGFLNGENSSVLDTTPTAATAATNTSNVGTYPITVSGGSDNNYNISYAAGILTVTKATLTATANNQSRAYGAANPALTISYTGFVNSETSSVLDTPPTTSTGAIATSAVGTYPITITGGLDNNYDFVYTAGTLTVTKATLTATANNQSRAYGAANPALTISYTGFVNSETSSVLDTQPTTSTGAIATSAVGTYPITITGGLDNNYDFVYTAGTLTITKATVTATAVDASRTYGASNPSFAITYSGFLNGENSSVLDTAPTASTAATNASNVGTYPITVSGGSDNNYNISYAAGTLTVTKASLTATANNQSRAYGAANPALTISYTGFVNSETSSVLDTPPTTSTGAIATSAVGTYPITITGGLDNNYDFVYTVGTLTITKATVTATAVDASRTYGASNPSFTITYSGFLNGENSSVLDTAPTAATTATNTSNVGTYPITVSGGSDNNYNISYAAGTLTVTKASLTATANNQSRAYGAANPALTISYTGFVNSETSSVLDTPPTTSTGAIATSAVGTYPITITGGLDNNYDFVYTAGTLTITKATVTATAVDASRTYGASNPSFTITYSGFLNGENSSALDVAPTASTVATIASNVGTYPITVSGGSDNNYNISYAAGTLTVTKAVLTVTADDKSRLYGSANPSFTISYSGFVNGETSSVISVAPSASSGATTSSSVGTYPITVTGGSATNYSFNYLPGTLTINKVMITATANNQSRSYGGTNPVLTVSYTGFVNSETSAVLDTAPIASTTAGATSVVGTYPITVGGGVDGNYDFTYVSGTLTIGKAILTATANNQSRTYGASNPVFTISYSGFANGETITEINTVPTAGTIATSGSAVGSYSITVTGGSDNNYDFNYVQGTLNITKATLTATANDQSRTYGVANPALTISYTGFVNSETSSVIDLAPTASSAATLTTPAGTYAINVAGGSDNNYDFVYFPGTLTITKATITAKAVDLSRLYGAANPVLAISYTGFLNGENSSVLDTTPTTSTAATLGSNVGTYPIVISGGADNNYIILLTDGTLTVTKANVTATAANASRVYGVVNPSFSIVYSGFVNGETSLVLDVVPTASSTAIISSSVGTYPITVSGGVDNNYSFTYVSGTLTITKATPVITWTNPADIVYGTPLSTTQLNATTTIPGTFIYNHPIGTILSVQPNHVLSVNFNPTDATNYNTVNGTTVVLAVTKATLTATPINQTRLYGSANPVFTIGYSGFVNGETTSVIDITPTASTTATPVSPVGTYPIIATGGSDNNYDLVYSPGTLTVTKATVTAIALDASRVYGSANPTFSITYTGLVNGENSTVLNSVPVAATTAILTSPVGTYSITVSGGSDDNYNFAYTSGTLTITKASIVATVSNASRVYGVANPSFSISYSGFVNGETASVFDLTPTATTTANLTSSVGAYPITVAGGSDNNYSFTYVNGTLTITKATPVVTWSNPAAITYGTALSATQLNATASVPGSFGYTPGAGTILNAGTNQILSTTFTPTDATNYNSVPATTVTITVNKANPAITWSNPLSITYGTPLSATQLNATANVPGTFVYTPPNGTVLNAGTNQTLSANFTPTDGVNYNPVFATTVSITVNKATPVVTWLTPSAITYGTALSSTQLNASSNVPGTFIYAPGIGTVLNAGTNQALSVNFNPTDAANYNSVNGTTVSITVNKATPVVTWATPAAISYGTALSATQLNATATVAGSFTYTPASGTILSSGANQVLSVNFNPTDLTNYNPVNGTTVVISVNKATPVITWPNPAAITYGTALSATQLNATSSVPGVFVYTPTLGTLLNAGNNQVLSVDFTPTDAANYNAVNDVQRLITVNKATPSITWANPAPIIYGTPLSSTQLNASSNVPGTFVYTPANGTILNVGVNQTLSLNFTPTDAINYNSIIGRTASITVNKATPVVTWATPLPIKVSEPLSSTQLNATANVPGTFTYTPSAGTSFGVVGTYTLSVAFNPTDASNYNSVPTTQVQIVVNNKDNPVVTWANPATINYGTTLSATQLNATANVPGTFVYTPALNTLLNAGANQTLSVNFIPTDGINYNSVNKSVQLTVNKATLTASAVSTSRIYGAANPTFSITYSGFVNSETAGVIDTSPTATCSAIAGDNAGGVFPIVPAGGVDNNYNFTYVSGSLSITKAPLTARADDKSRSYGLANPGFTISYTGFVNGDTESEITTPTASTSATSLSNVGAYPITLNGGSSINYNLTLQNGVLTINVSPLIARASDNTKTYGQSNPTFSIVYSGFLNGDNASSITPPNINTTATTTSAVGTYPITLSGGSALNYGIILQSGTLTITKASLTVTANNQSRVYAAANPSLTISYTGFVNGETSVVIDSAPIASTTATVLSPVGTYPISVSGGADNNYNLTIVSGSLSITKATLTASAANATRLYGSVNPGFTINYAGFLNGDDLSVIDIIPIASTSAVISSPVNSYAITVAGGADNNYNFNYIPATLTVLKATLVATAQAASRAYGTPNPGFVINYSGFVNGETVSVLDIQPTATTAAIVTSPVGNYPITVSGGSDNNYSISYVNSSLSIVKATPVITWANPTTIIFGTPLSATQLNASANVAGSFIYTPGNGTVLNAGPNQILSATFNPTDATNYNAVIGSSVSITVNKATPSVTWSTPASITYGTTLTSTQLNATASVPGTFAYNPPGGTTLNAGPNQVLSVNFTPTDAANYNLVSNTTVQITVNKGTPVITWPGPSAITYGTPLGNAQLNASANVPGVFTYTPALGTILNAGVNQTLSTNFTPTDASNYNSVNGTTVQITVNKATPVITWPMPAAITYGTALGATQLNASANTAGTFTYTPANGTILNTGPNQILSANFAPTNTSNFNSVNGTTVLITVNKATPIITWANPAAISYGTALSTTQLNATANVPGTFSYSPTSGSVLTAGPNQPLTVDFIPTNSANYNSVNGTSVLITVNKVNLTATANGSNRIYGTPNPTLTVSYNGFVNGEIENVLDVLPIANTIASTSSSVGVYEISVAGGADNNYSFVYVPGSLTINKAALTVTAENQTRLFGTPNPSLTMTYSGFVNNDTVLDLDILPSAVTNATISSPVGGYPITVSGGSDNNYNFGYVQGLLTVTPNFPPTINNFEITTKEDEQLNFSYSTFDDNFSSFSNSTIAYIKIISLPVNGVLFWKGAAISAGAEITVTNGAIDNFFYLPNTNFNGFDAFRWNAFEGTFLALQDATASIRITKVNDAPVLANIETESILYSLGDPAAPITKTTVINDVDDTFIYSAKISIGENFSKGDMLSVDAGVSSEIKPSYNSTNGELTLAGKDSRANYELALAKVLFSSPVSGDATISDKRINIIVRDSLDNSNVISRIVSITEVFPELDIVNSFTPNDDGVNDYWDFVNLEFYSGITISVFDRNGRNVFECKTSDCKWDGRLNGKELPPGSYFYTIYLNGGKRKYQGTVTILK